MKITNTTDTLRWVTLRPVDKPGAIRTIKLQPGDSYTCHPADGEIQITG